MFKVALVGRPNVGKSTLFNRLVGSRNAIVNDQPGVTRDRKYGTAKLADLEFILIDTAGIDDTLKGNLDNEIKFQTNVAIEESDLVIFVIDGRAGVLPAEKTFSKKLKISNKPVIILVNKCEGSGGMLGLTESSSFGSEVNETINASVIDYFHHISKVIKDKIPLISRNAGVYKMITDLFPTIRLGIIGRPNTGKSTLLNSIVDQRRVLLDQKQV